MPRTIVTDSTDRQAHSRRIGQGCAKSTRSEVERLCIARGLKMTEQRRTIARVLSEATDHPDVEEVYRRAALLDDRISVATTYRTVRLLEEKGILQKRDFGSGRARYEAADHGDHHHLIDIATGTVTEFQDGEHEQLVESIARGLGFELVSLRLEVFGRSLEDTSNRLEPAPKPSRKAATPS